MGVLKIYANFCDTKLIYPLFVRYFYYYIRKKLVIRVAKRSAFEGCLLVQMDPLPTLAFAKEVTKDVN